MAQIEIDARRKGISLEFETWGSNTTAEFTIIASGGKIMIEAPIQNIIEELENILEHIKGEK